MSVTEVGTLVSIISTLLFIVLSVAAFLVRRAGKESKETRELREQNVAFWRYKYRVDTLAARRGWDTDSEWPPTPRELTAEYLAERAASADNADVLEFAERLRRSLGGGDPK